MDAKDIIIPLQFITEINAIIDSKIDNIIIIDISSFNFGSDNNKIKCIIDLILDLTHYGGLDMVPFERLRNRKLIYPMINNTYTLTGIPIKYIINCDCDLYTDDNDTTICECIQNITFDYHIKYCTKLIFCIL